MRSLQIVAPGEAVIQQLPIPKPAPGQVLVKVLAVTTCPHWDLHVLAGEPMFPGGTLEYPYQPGQPGHEACGDIAAVGEGVTSVEVGERVCAWRDQGHGRPGCYAEYVLIDEPNVIRVPNDLPAEACAPLELAMCMSAHVMFAERLGAIAGRRVGVFGLGPAGLVAVQLLRAAGAAEVVGFDPLPQRRALAGEYGADPVLDPASPEAKAFPARNTPGCLGCAIDCVGTSAAVHEAMRVTQDLVVLFAVQREPYVFAPEYWGGFTLAGTQPHSREAAQYAVERIRAGTLDLGGLVTARLPLSEYTKGVDMLRRKEAVKVAFLPAEG